LFTGGGTNFTENGTAKGARPGNRVCLRCGSYPSLRLQQWNGSAEAPIEFINCYGRVVIGSPTSTNVGIAVDASSFIRMTGTGSLADTYGIFVAGTRAGTQGVAFAGLSTDVEAEVFEVAHSGFAGFMAKTDPTCANDDAVRGHFTTRNTVLHDNYVHDTSGEGFYIGNSFWAGGEALTCNGTSVHKLPHDMVGGLYLQSPTAMWTATANLVTTDAASVMFVDAAHDDYHLQHASPAIGHGVDLGSNGITFDHDRHGRDDDRVRSGSVSGEWRWAVKRSHGRTRAIVL